MTLDLSPLRKRAKSEKKPLAMITVRLNSATHERLLAEAQTERVSLNGLCVALLEHWLAGRAHPPAAEQEDASPAAEQQDATPAAEQDPEAA
jgi:hypothetical protein